MAMKTILLLATLPGSSSFFRRDFGRGFLHRTSSHHRHPITTTFASFNHPVGEKRSYSTEYDVPTFKLGRGAKNGGVPTRLQSWVTSGVASINSNYGLRTPSNTTPPLRILATMVALSIATYITHGIVVATVLSVAILFVYATSKSGTNRFLQPISSFTQQVDRVVRRAVQQFQALEKASTITPPRPVKRTTSVTSTTSQSTVAAVVTSNDNPEDHNNNLIIHTSSLVSSLQSTPDQYVVQSNTIHQPSLVNPSTVQETSPSSLRPSFGFLPINQPPLSSEKNNRNTRTANGVVSPISYLTTPTMTTDHPQHAAMNKAMEIQAALDASSARFTNWYRQQTEDRRRLKYLHDLSNDFDRMIDREDSSIGQTNSNDDSDGCEVWSVDGGMQSQSNDIPHAQSNVLPAQSNDLPAQSKDRDDFGSGNDDKSTVDDDDVWTVSGGIMSAAVVHEQQLQHQLLHGHHDQSNIITQTPSNDITHAQSNDLPSQSNDFHIQSNDLPSQSNDLQSNDLAPSLQSLAWRQWGKSIDWGRVHGQGSDIYSLAQGNPPISTTPSRVMATPSRAISTPSRVIATPNRVTTTPSRTTPTAIIRPLPRPQAAVQGLGHVDAHGQGLPSQPHNVSVISLSSHAQLNSTHGQSNDHTASDSSIYSNGNSGTSISSLSTSPSPSIQNSNVVVNAAVTHTTTSACVGGTVDHVQSNNSTHAQSNITLVQSNEQPVHQVSSPLALALAVALVPVRQSPLLSAAASSTFGTPTLAQMAGQALLGRHKQPQYNSDPRSHNNNNNNNKNSNSNNKKINDNKHSIVGTTTKQPPPQMLSTQPPPKPPPPHHHQLQPHHAHPHLPKPLRELEEERVWISTVLKRARDQAYHQKLWGWGSGNKDKG